MRPLCETYLISGKALPVPDAPVKRRQEPLQAPSSGRDESGHLHWRLLRNLTSWELSWSHVTPEEYAYLQGLAAGTFPFTDGNVTYDAVCTGWVAEVSDADGHCRSLRLTLTQC